MSQSTCIFCAIIHGSIPAQIIFKSEGIIVIKDIVPKAPTHYLIIPEQHVPDISSLSTQDMALGASIFKVAQELGRNLPGSQAFRLIINNGADAGQSVFHLHAHFLSGKVLSDF